MTEWDSWLNDVMPELPGALPPVVRQALLRASQEFFRRSLVWKQDLEIQLLPGMAEYSLSPDEGLVPVEVVDHGRLRISLTDEDMTCHYGPDWRAAVGPVMAIYQTSPGSVRMYPVPAEPETLVLSVAVMPADSAVGIPTDFADRYRDGIAAGALARLMRSPKKPFTDDAHGAIQASLFEQAIGRAIEDRAKGFGRTRVRRAVTWY